MLLDTPELKTVVLAMTDRDVTGQTFAERDQTEPRASAALDGLDEAVTVPSGIHPVGRRLKTYTPERARRGAIPTGLWPPNLKAEQTL
ncbi:hypothetical protein L0Z26_21375 [Burkholderia multivorans]|uniref:hypothetical protein n=1 Tax=Burkholderia multivorans TaxID=87883 RepID=UPI001E32EE69|nr:hypothetical protein [Burkholderia multivorans]MCO1344442.1 hypothetical protein [Burkholderia multivorans]MCO1441764.1 hypothetical protein [Burkholderia multivorans]MDR8749443.1 hypothetical protein [Burkholderia multivorans]MDR8808371.1 hypothetical protein [Burkholderia multivorans]UQO28364.1 hypothetical protein L0Z21_15700 [Burkholderia multivorans]